MAEPNWPRHALSAGVFEYRRSVRAIREDTGRLVLLAGSVLLPTLLLGGMAALFAPLVRENVPTGARVPPAMRGGAALFWLFGVFLLAQRTANAHGEPVAAPFVLTTVSPRTAVVGGALAEWLRVLTYVLPTGVLVTVGGAYAFASPAPLLTVPLVGCLFVASAVVAGRLAGYTAAWLVARIPFVARHRTALSGVVAIGFFGVYMLFQLPTVPYSLDPALLGAVPLGWVVDLLAVGTPIEWSAAHAVGGLATVSVVLAGGGWTAERIAGSLWFGDEVDPTDDGGGDRPTTDRSAAGALQRAISPLRAPLVTGPTRQVARWTLLRARREPQRLNFLMVPVFGGASGLLSMLLQGNVSLSVLGPGVALLAGWTGGAAFALNPLGDEGPVLPATLTATSGRTYVRGLIAPALLALPVVAAVTLAAALGGGYGPLTALALAFVGCLLTAVGAVLAPAIGMWFPRYSAIRIGNSDEVRPPRLLAGALHGIAVFGPGAALVGVVVAPEVVRLVLSGVGSVPGFLLGLAAGGSGPLAALASTFDAAGASIRALPLATVQFGAGGLLVAGGLVAGWAGYREAIRRFDGHEPY
jgi:ABC-2 type transport system permease protein